MEHIDTYTCDKIDKISSADYDFDHYNRAEGFSQIADLTAMAYLACSLSSVRKFVEKDTYCNAVDDLPCSLTPSKSGMGFSKDEALMVVHNLLQIVHHKDTEISGELPGHILAWIGMLNVLRGRQYPEDLGKLMPGYNEMSKSDQLQQFLMFVAISLPGMLMPEESEESDCEKNSQEKKVKIWRMASKFFADQKESKLCFQVEKTTRIEDMGYFTTIQIETKSLSPTEIWVNVNAQTCFRIPYLVGHEVFDTMKLSRLRKVIIDQKLVDHNFVFVSEPSDLSKLPSVLMDSTLLKDFTQSSKLQLHLAKFVKTPSVNDRANDAFFVNSSAGMVCLKVKIGHVVKFLACNGSCPDEFLAKEIEELTKECEKECQRTSSKLKEGSFEAYGGSIVHNLKKKECKNPQFFSFERSLTKNPTENTPKSTKAIDLDFTLEEILSVYSNLQLLEQTVYKENSPPNVLIIKTDGLLNTVSASVLMRSISDRSFLLQGVLGKHFQIRGFFCDNGQEGKHVLINTRNVKNIYPLDKKVSLVSHTQGELQIDRKTLNPEDIKYIIYELKAIDND